MFGVVHDTGHGCTFQISAAYSAMVRSLENFPEAATFKIALLAQALGSPYRLHQTLIGLQVGLQVRQVQVVVAVGQERVQNRGEDAGLLRAEVVGRQSSPEPAAFPVRFRSASADCTSRAYWPLAPPSGRTGKSSPRPPPAAISIVAPSRVPMVRAPFIMNFMLLVPLAS